jgi:hypothetical protein
MAQEERPMDPRPRDHRLLGGDVAVDVIPEAISFALKTCHFFWLPCDRKAESSFLSKPDFERALGAGSRAREQGAGRSPADGPDF